MVAGLLFSVLLAAEPQGAAPSAAPGADPAALRRIAAALAQPVRLRISAPQPTFHIEIQQHPYFRELPFTWNWAGAGGVPTGAPHATGSGTPPLVQVDVLPLLRDAVHAMSERAAEREVQRAVAEFCATHACDH